MNAPECSCVGPQGLVCEGIHLQHQGYMVLISKIIDGLIIRCLVQKKHFLKHLLIKVTTAMRLVRSIIMAMKVLIHQLCETRMELLVLKGRVNTSF